MPSHKKAHLNLSRPQSENSSPPLHRVPSSSLPCSPSAVSDTDKEDNDGLSGSLFDCLPLSPPLSPWKQPPQHDQHEELLSFFPAAPLSSFSALHTTTTTTTTGTALFSCSPTSTSLSREHSSQLFPPASLSSASSPRLYKQTSFSSSYHSVNVHSSEFASVYSVSHIPEHHHRALSPYPSLRRRPSSHSQTAAPSDLFNTAIDKIFASSTNHYQHHNNSDEFRSWRHQVASFHQNHDVNIDHPTTDSRTNSGLSISTTSTRSSTISNMSSESSTGLSTANSDHDHPMANDATSATTSATTSASDPNLRGSTNDSSVDVSATSATEIEIKQESLTTLAMLPLPSQTSQPPSSPPAAVKKEEDGNVDELADKSKDADASEAPTSAPSEQTLLVLPPAPLEPELTPKPDPDAHATDLAQSVGNTNVDADGDITMKNEPPMGTFDVAMQIDPVSAAADADAEAAAVVAAVVATGLPAVLSVPDTVAGISLAEVPPIPMVGVPNNEGEQEQLLSPSPSPQRVDSPSQQQQQQQQQQDRRSSHSPSSSSSSLKPTAGDTKPRSKSFDATAASAAIATATSNDVTSSTSSSAAAGSSSSTTTTGKAPRVRKGAPPSEKKPLKVYPPRKQRSRVNWDEAKVPPESPLSTLASAAVAVSTLSAATAITPASTMPITPTVSATNGGSVTAVSGVTSTSTAGGSAGGAVTVTTHHVVPDDATLQALSKARAQLAAEGGGYRCELCPGERFGRVHDLKRHHISKHNEMTWPCDFCHRPFVRRDALLRHYTVKAARNDGVHPTQDEPERLSEARARAKLLS